MKLKKIRLIMAALALVAFVSQSFAVVDNHCSNMPDHSQSSFTSADMSKHLHHDMSEAMETTAANCCDHQQCNSVDCASAGSVILAALSKTVLLTTNSANTLHSFYSVSYISTDQSTLFRPPISH